MTCIHVSSPELLLADSRVLSSRLCSGLRHSCTGFDGLCQALSAARNALCMPAGVDECVAGVQKDMLGLVIAQSVAVFRRTWQV